MEEKETLKDVDTMKRGRTGDLWVVSNTLMLAAGDVIWNHGRVLACSVTIIMPASLALQQQVSTNTNGKIDGPSLDCLQGTCPCLRAMWNWPHERSSPGRMRTEDLALSITYCSL